MTTAALTRRLDSNQKYSVASSEVSSGSSHIYHTYGVVVSGKKTESTSSEIQLN